MAKGNQVRESMIAATARLVAENGVSATGMQDIVAAAAAPRGSIYHHFPDGKDELLISAIDHYGSGVVTMMERIAEGAPNAQALVARVGAALRQTAEQANWTIGCPIAATTIEGDRQSPPVRAAVAAMLDRWVSTMTAGLSRFVPTEIAREQSLMVVTSLQGALLVARGMRSGAPYDATAALLDGHFAQWTNRATTSR